MPIIPTGTAYAAMEVRDPKIISRGLYVTSGNQYFDAGWPATTGILTSGANFGDSGHYTMQAQVEPYSNVSGLEHCIGIFIRRNWAITTDRVNDPNFRRNCELLKFGVFRMQYVALGGGTSTELKESELVCPVASGFSDYVGSYDLGDCGSVSGLVSGDYYGQTVLGKVMSPIVTTGQYADIFINSYKPGY